MTKIENTIFDKIYSFFNLTSESNEEIEENEEIKNIEKNEKIE